MFYNFLLSTFYSFYLFFHLFLFFPFFPFFKIFLFFNNMNNEKIKFLFNDKNNWVKSLKDYEFSKKHLEWSFNEKPKYIKQKQILFNDVEFNPITQRFTNEEKEKVAKRNEDKKLKQSLSQNYDRSLQYEQTYNIINLKSKLIGLNYKEEQKDKKTKRISPDKRVPYNIISNISLNIHNSISPDKRIKYPDCENKHKPNIIKSYLYKDYDIISNKYKLFDKEKQKIDKEIRKLNSLSQLNKRKDFDFIKNQYYNEELNKINPNKSLSKGNIIPYRGQLYNPINMNVYDSENLKKKDEKNSRGVIKYKIRNKLDEYYHFKNEENLINEKKKINNNCDYRKYINIDKRGYNILNFERNYNRYHDNYEMKNHFEPWKILKDNVGENETLSKKKLYIPKTKKEELDDKLKDFIINRKNIINNLNNINEEESFKRKPLINKKIYKNKKLFKSYSQSNIFLNKQEWFSHPKNCDMEKMDFPKKSIIKGKEIID